jgi:hypothetical protein
VHLQAGGWLLLEHGYDQSEAVRALLTPTRLCRCSVPDGTCRASNAARWQVERNGGIITYRTPSVEFNDSVQLICRRAATCPNTPRKNHHG